MCVALPGKVIEIKERDAVVDFNGNQVTARAGLVDVKVGDYVLVHAGCVIQKVTQQDMEDLKNLKELMSEQEVSFYDITRDAGSFSKL